VPVFDLPERSRVPLAAVLVVILLMIVGTCATPPAYNRPELNVLPVKLPIAPVPVGVVTLKNRTLTPVARLFIDGTREFARRLMKGKP
jgi:DNA-binding transcriptional LysR family regulator